MVKQWCVLLVSVVTAWLSLCRDWQRSRLIDWLSKAQRPTKHIIGGLGLSEIVIRQHRYVAGCSALTQVLLYTRQKTFPLKQQKIMKYKSPNVSLQDELLTYEPAKLRTGQPSIFAIQVRHLALLYHMYYKTDQHDSSSCKSTFVLNNQSISHYWC